MESLIQSTHYQKFVFDQNRKCLIIEWQPNTTLMNAEEYRQEQLQTLQMVLTHQPKYLLINTKQMGFIITPDLQVWTSENLVEPCMQSSVTKCAFVMPLGFVEQVAIEQAVEENTRQLEATRFFKTIEDAMQWLES